MNNKTMLVMLIGIVAFLSPSNLIAQDDDDDGHIFTVSTYQWPFNNLEDIFELIEKDLELTKQNEFLLSQKTLVHQWAGAFSVMILREYASFEDIAKAQERNTELIEAKYPKKKDRDARSKKFAALAGDGIHEDSILQENTKLAK